MSVPLKTGGMNVFKTLLITFLSGVPTAIGAYIGMIIGNISKLAVAGCLAFAGGTMAYIISGDLVPESKKIYSGRLPSLFNVLGFVLGIIAVKMF